MDGSGKPIASTQRECDLVRELAELSVVGRDAPQDSVRDDGVARPTATPEDTEDS
jgi:hypothetical protein